NEESIVKSCSALNIELLRKYGSFKSAIFMGLGEGTLVDAIGREFCEATVVEASDRLVAQARVRFAASPTIKLVNAYFETYEQPSEHQVSCVLGNHVLEHLDNPGIVLQKTRAWLTPGGLA